MISVFSNSIKWLPYSSVAKKLKYRVKKNSLKVFTVAFDYIMLTPGIPPTVGEKRGLVFLKKKEDFQSKRGKKRCAIFGQYNINRPSYKSQDKIEHAFIETKNAFKILFQYEKFKTVPGIH